MKAAVRRAFIAVCYVLIWVAVYFLLVGLSAQRAEGQEAPTVTCSTFGRDIHCVSQGADTLDLVPLWVLHTKPLFQAYGLDFTAASPAKWTQLTTEFYLNDGSTVRACLEVARIDGRAKMRKPCGVGQ